MAMDGAVPAKDHHYISLFDPRRPLCTRSTLECGNTPGYIPRPEDRSGAHVRRKLYQKLERMSSCLNLCCRPTLVIPSGFSREESASLFNIQCCTQTAGSSRLKPFGMTSVMERPLTMTGQQWPPRLGRPV